MEDNEKNKEEEWTLKKDEKNQEQKNREVHQEN